MTTYPYEAGEAERFVPPSLAHLDNPPTFWLRQGTPREKRRQRRMMDEEGLRTHDQASLRDEMLRGMKELFSAEDYAAWQPKAKEYWDAQDAFAEEHKNTPPDDVPDFVFDDELVLIEVLNQVGKDWRPVRIMTADNREANRMIPDVVNSVIIARFENIDVEPVFYAGFLTMDCAAELTEALEALEIDDPAKVSPALELRAECLMRLYLGKGREKNSSSPPPSSATPDSLKTGTASKAGKSKASASSAKIPEPS